MDIDFEKIRKEYSIFDVAERVVGLQRASGNSSHARYYYPGQEHKSPTLVAYSDSNRMTSYREQAISPNGQRTASSIDLVMHFLGVDVVEAVERITNQTVAKPDEIKKRATTYKKSKRYLGASDVLQPYRNLHRAIPYLKSRGITPEYAKMCRLGYHIAYQLKTPTKLNLSDTERISVNYHPANRLSIPVFKTNPRFNVRAISLRLDTEDAKQRLEMANPDTLALVEQHANYKISKGSNKSVEELMISAMFGDKYISLQTSRFVYQWWNVVKWNGSQYVLPRLPFALVMEGQFDAALSYIHAGIPAISIGSGAQNLERMLKNVEHVYVIADNDDEMTDTVTGEIYSPGEDIANRYLRSMNRTDGNTASILRPYAGFKDFTDMYEYGAFNDWLRDNNLTKKEFSHAI